MPHTLSLDVAVAHALEDVLAAVYLAAVFESEAFPGARTHLSIADVTLATGMTTAQAQKARTKLLDAGVLSPLGGGHAVVHEVLDELVARTPALQRAVEVPAADRAIDPADIFAGRFDQLSGERAMKTPGLPAALVAIWATAWHKRSRGVSKEQRAALRQALVEQRRTASEIARGIVGMLEDEWPERPERCDLKYVVKGLDRWLVLFDEVHVAQSRASRAGTISRKTKTVRSVVVPADYVWTREDDVAVDLGHRFESGFRSMDVEAQPCLTSTATTTRAWCRSARFTTRSPSRPSAS